MGIKTLPEESFDAASDFVLHSARALERNIYNQIFNGGNPDKSVLELKNYQNPDGGFGHGLEPDLRLPYSSPITTTVAFRTLEEMDETSKVAENIVQSGMNYFENTFQSESERWFAVPPEINEFAHAPWWHYDPNSGKTPADKYWGIPTAEILAYGLKYDGFSSEIDMDYLVETTMGKINESDKLESEHELLCYLKLYDSLPAALAKRIKERLSDAVEHLVCTDPSRWNENVSQPLYFVKSPKSPMLGISEDILKRNLDFLIEKIIEEGVIEPSWEWGQFESEWERAKLEWTGILTLEALIILDKFDRLSRKIALTK